MTGTQDLDPRLSDWLADGPSRAPDRTIGAAVDHARTHPRRRDPFAFVRTDPMGSNRSISGFHPLPLVAALGLLVAAALTVATVGGFFNARLVIQPLPLPSASPSSAPSASPTASPTTTPSATPTGPALPLTFRVDLTVAAGNPTSVVIFDDSGTLLRAASGTPGDGGSVEDGTVQVVADPTDPNTLVLTWTGSPCDTTHEMNVSQDARTIAISRPACSGDSLPLDRVLRLTFDRPVPAASVTATIATIGG